MISTTVKLLFVFFLLVSLLILFACKRDWYRLQFFFHSFLQNKQTLEQNEHRAKPKRAVSARKIYSRGIVVPFAIVIGCMRVCIKSLLAYYFPKSVPVWRSQRSTSLHIDFDSKMNEMAYHFRSFINWRGTTQ